MKKYMLIFLVLIVSLGSNIFFVCDNVRLYNIRITLDEQLVKDVGTIVQLKNTLTHDDQIIAEQQDNMRKASITLKDQDQALKYTSSVLTKCMVSYQHAQNVLDSCVSSYSKSFDRQQLQYQLDVH